MRWGAKGGMSPGIFDMPRTDLAGLAMLAAVVVFLAILYLATRD